MQSCTVRAPAVVKLFGEHAVVYGYTCVAAAVDLYARAKVSKTKNGFLTIDLKKVNEVARADNGLLHRVYDEYEQRKTIESYGRGLGVSQTSLPYITIAAKFARNFGVDLNGMKVELTSDVPARRGLASSASCYVSFVCALAKEIGIRLSDIEVIELAREGEKIVHRNDGAGKIDIGTSYLGGVVSYDSARGAVREKVGAKLKLLLVDTGPKKSTAETVGKVAELRRKDVQRFERLLLKIQECAVSGLQALRAGDVNGVGEEMYRNHELLRQAGVSSEGLDRAVRVAKEHNALGAKLSGGGGGGIAVLLLEGFAGSAKITEALEAEGFETAKASVSQEGGKRWLRE